MKTQYIFDFDSTLVGCESLDELARMALAKNPNREHVMDELESITRAGMSGKLAFDESLQQRLKLFQASKRQVVALTSWLQDQISPSVLRERQWFADHAARIYVVSGGFRDYIVPVVTRLGIHPDHVLANQFVYDKTGIITGYDDTLPTSRPGGKVLAVQSLQLPGPVVMVGDGYTDFEVKSAGAANEFWVYTAHVERPEVVAHADRVLRQWVRV